MTALTATAMANQSDKFAAELRAMQAQSAETLSYEEARRELFRDSLDVMRVEPYPYRGLQQRLRGLMHAAEEVLQMLNGADQ